ncbi:FMN-binding protein [Treponema pallidum]|nr:FMN-binding protein [Treponema pallidum]
MSALFSLVAVYVLVCALHKQIKKYASVCYLGSACVSVAVVCVVWSGATKGNFGVRVLLHPLTSASFSTAIFTFVMCASVLKNGLLKQRVMGLRAELAITAAILTLGHNIAHGRDYLVRLCGSTGDLSTGFLVAGAVSMVLVLLMSILAVTSFKVVRRRMGAKTWKRVQRLAYLFYGLTYVHLSFILLPTALRGYIPSVVSYVLYTVIFATYALLRVRKALGKRKGACALCSAAVAVSFVAFVLGASHMVRHTRRAHTERTTRAKARKCSPAEMKDGVYEASAQGHNGKLSLRVTISQGRIEAVTVVGHSDDDPYASWAVEGVSAAIVGAQSTDIDVVSEATSTSEAIIRAVEKILQQPQP